MQLIIESPGLKPQESLLQLVRSRFEHLGNMSGESARCRVLLRKERVDHHRGYRVEANLSIPGKVLFAGHLNDDFETSLHKVVDKLSRQLYRYHHEHEEIW